MRIQTELEEQLNAITHGIGAVLGIAGLILMIILRDSDMTWSLFSVLIYGISIIILFLASTLYHSFRQKRLKHYFRVVDHVSIYFLIAGTYTPVLLLTLAESNGWVLFWLIWILAVIGIVLKLFFTGRFNLVSTLFYLFMGWLILFDLGALIENMAFNGLMLLLFGGMSYTLGLFFYLFERIPFNHVIWHLFVLGGAMCHFFMVLFFVI